MPVTDVREVITDLIAQVTPLDDVEAASQTAILEWIATGAPLFRSRAPDFPPMHLAVYFALLDEQPRSVLLVDHIKAGCWLCYLAATSTQGRIHGSRCCGKPESNSPSTSASMIVSVCSRTFCR